MSMPHVNHLSGFDFLERADRSDVNGMSNALRQRIAGVRVADESRVAVQGDALSGKWPMLFRTTFVLGASAALWASVITLAVFVSHHI